MFGLMDYHRKWVSQRDLTRLTMSVTPLLVFTQIVFHVQLGNDTVHKDRRTVHNSVIHLFVSGRNQNRNQNGLDFTLLQQQELHWLGSVDC